MKRICLIIGSLMAIANASASNEVVDTTRKTVNMEHGITEFSCEECTLNFSKESKVVISDEEGHVIFYHESVQDLDISDWMHGIYLVRVNDKELFEFTL